VPAEAALPHSYTGGFSPDLGAMLKNHNPVRKTQENQHKTTRYQKIVDKIHAPAIFDKGPDLRCRVLFNID
jgi:hypothetical protein